MPKNQQPEKDDDDEMNIEDMAEAPEAPSMLIGKRCQLAPVKRRKDKFGHFIGGEPSDDMKRLSHGAHVAFITRVYVTDEEHPEYDEHRRGRAEVLVFDASELGPARAVVMQVHLETDLAWIEK